MTTNIIDNEVKRDRPSFKEKYLEYMEKLIREREALGIENENRNRYEEIRKSYKI